MTIASHFISGLEVEVTFFFTLRDGSLAFTRTGMTSSSVRPPLSDINRPAFGCIWPRIGPVLGTSPPLCPTLDRTSSQRRVIFQSFLCRQAYSVQPVH